MISRNTVERLRIIHKCGKVSICFSLANFDCILLVYREMWWHNIFQFHCRLYRLKFFFFFFINVLKLDFLVVDWRSARYITSDLLGWSNVMSFLALCHNCNWLSNKYMINTHRVLFGDFTQNREVLIWPDFSCFLKTQGRKSDDPNGRICTRGRLRRLSRLV